MLRVFEMLVSSVSFWLLTLIVVVACVIPDYLIRVYNCYRPTFITRRNEEQPQYIIVNSNDNTENVPLETRVRNIHLLQVQISYDYVLARYLTSVYVWLFAESRTLQFCSMEKHFCAAEGELNKVSFYHVSQRAVSRLLINRSYDDRRL